MPDIAKLKERARSLELGEQWSAALALYRQAAEQAGESDIGLWNRIGDLHVRLGQVERAVEAYTHAIDAYAEAGLHNNAIALCNKVLRLAPTRDEVTLRLGQISAAQGFFADARESFLRYAERMQRAGRLDDAFAALEQFADLTPQDPDVRWRLAQQLLQHGHAAEALPHLLRVRDLLRATGTAEDAERVEQQIRELDAHVDLTTDAPRPARSPRREAAEPPRASPGLLPTLDVPAAVAATDAGALTISPLEGFEPTRAADEGAATESPPPELLPLLDIVPTSEAEPPRETGSDADAGAEPAPEEPLALLDLAPPAPDALGAPAPQDDEPAGEPLPLLDVAEWGTAPAAAAEVAAPPDPLEPLHRALAARPWNADAVAEGVAELARTHDLGAALALLDAAQERLAADGRFAEAADLLRLLLAHRGGDSALHRKQAEYAFRSGDRARTVAAYVALAQHLTRSGQPEKAAAVFGRVLELEPGHSAARAALAPRPATPAAADGFVDLGALVMEPEPAGPSTRFTLPELEPSGDEDRDFEAMLGHFREKVSQHIGTQDAASHYDLGLAFKEMGLLDEAIAEFQVALRGGAPRLALLEVLGECFVEKRQHTLATRVLERALALPHGGEADVIGVLYWLARCDEALGRPERARELYERVLAQDIRFRDAARRLAALPRAAPSSRL